MTALIEPFLGLSYGWSFEEPNWNGGMDSNMQRLAAVVQIGVKSRSMNITDIVTPSANDRYIVPATGVTGVFVGKENQLAYFRNSAWFFIAPKDGYQARVVDTDEMVVYKSATTSWSAFGAPITGSGFPDDPNDGNYYVRKLHSWQDLRSVPQQVINVSGTTYTLAAGDRNALIRMTNAAPNTLTVPPNSSVTLAIGVSVMVGQIGTGVTSIVPGAGVTINAPEALTMRRQLSYVTLTKVSTNEWDLIETDGGAGGNGGNPTTPVGYSSNITIDFRVNDKFSLTLAGTPQIDFVGGFDGQQINLRLKQDGTGGRTVIWGPNVRFGSDLTGLSISSTPNKADYVGVIYCADDDKYDVVAFLRGF